MAARRGGQVRSAAGAEPEPAWWRSGGVSLPSVAAPLLVLPAAILMIESILLRPLYVDRYVLYGEAGAALLAGAGLYRIGRWLGDTPRPAPVWLPGVIVCLSAFWSCSSRRSTTSAGRGAAGTTTAARRATWERTRGRVTGSSSSGSSTGRPNWVTRAISGIPVDFAQAVSPLQVGNFQGRDKPAGVTLPLMLGYRRIWVFGARPSLRRPEAELRAESRCCCAATPWSGSASSTASWSRSGSGAEAQAPLPGRPRARPDRPGRAARPLTAGQPGGRLHSPSAPSRGREGAAGGHEPRKRETMAKTKQKKAGKKAEKKSADKKASKKAEKKNAGKKNGKKATRPAVIEKAEQATAALKTVPQLPEKAVTAVGRQVTTVARRTRTGAAAPKTPAAAQDCRGAQDDSCRVQDPGGRAQTAAAPRTTAAASRTRAAAPRSAAAPRTTAAASRTRAAAPKTAAAPRTTAAASRTRGPRPRLRRRPGRQLPRPGPGRPRLRLRRRPGPQRPAARAPAQTRARPGRSCTSSPSSATCRAGPG